MEWNVKKLLIPPAILTLLLLSWLTASFRPYWDAIDSGCFYYLNTWVQKTPFWQHFWAFMGTRMMDWIHDAIMLLFFFFSIKMASEKLKARKVAELLLTIFILTLAIFLVNGTFFPDFLHMRRDSPTLADDQAFRLSSVIEWTKVKDHSRKSFPGDHASTAILFASLIYHLMGWRVGILATLYAIIFCLPRLIAGAHWLTDILLGSSLTAIAISSFFMGSPLGGLLIQFFEASIQKLRTCRKYDSSL